MTKQELIEKAEFKGSLILENRAWHSGQFVKNVFYEIVHYFDKNMVEIGYTFNDNVVIFVGGREWHQSFIDKYVITKMNCN